MIRLYLLSDDGFESGSLNNNGPDSVGNAENSNNFNYPGGWTPPYIMVIKYSGKKRPVR